MDTYKAGTVLRGKYREDNNKVDKLYKVKRVSKLYIAAHHSIIQMGALYNEFIQIEGE